MSDPAPLIVRVRNKLGETIRQQDCYSVENGRSIAHHTHGATRWMVLTAGKVNHLVASGAVNRHASQQVDGDCA